MDMVEISKKISPLILGEAEVCLFFKKKKSKQSHFGAYTKLNFGYYTIEI